MYSGNLSQYIKQYLPIKNIEKKNFGEVFTPQSQIEKMYNKLPDNIWVNPDLKWLDPSGGVGNFLMVAYDKLFNGLKTHFPNPKKRSQHIIQNMLYMVEINSNNVEIAQNIFGKKANIIHDDFFIWITNKSSMTFDVIVGNPPFNACRSFVKKNSTTIWQKFVFVILTDPTILSPGGYLTLLHPPTWRKPTTDKSFTNGLFELMTHQNQMLYLEMHHFSDGLKLFKSETRYDWYIIQKTQATQYTEVCDQEGVNHKLDLTLWTFLPNYDISIIRCYLRTQDIECVPILYSRTQFGSDKEWTSPIKTLEFCYPLIHSTPKKGIRYYYTNTKKPYVKKPIALFGISKIIFGEGGIRHVVIDMDGSYGTTGEAMSIPIHSYIEGIRWKNLLLSTEFLRIIQAFNYGYFRIDWRMFMQLRYDLPDIIHIEIHQ